MANKKPLSKDELIHLSHLANLTLTDGELVKYGKQLEETLDYMNNLSQLSTDNVAPTNQVGGMTNIVFQDGQENKRLLQHKEALQNAKGVKNDCFVVKRIL